MKRSLSEPSSSLGPPTRSGGERDRSARGQAGGGGVLPRSRRRVPGGSSEPVATSCRCSASRFRSPAS
eukprot:13293682-Alexandrium_andersonii.AAC.1